MCNRRLQALWIKGNFIFMFVLPLQTVSQPLFSHTRFLWRISVCFRPFILCVCAAENEYDFFLFPFRVVTTDPQTENRKGNHWQTGYAFVPFHSRFLVWSVKKYGTIFLIIWSISIHFQCLLYFPKQQSQENQRRKKQKKKHISQLSWR